MSEYDLIEEDLGKLTPVSSENTPTTQQPRYELIDEDVGQLTPVSQATQQDPAEQPEESSFLDSSIDTAKAAGAGISNATLGMAESIMRTPDMFKRGYGALYSMVTGKDLPDRYNPISYLTDGFNAGGYEVQSFTDIADHINAAQNMLPEMSQTFADLQRAGKEADEAFDGALGGEFEKLGQVVSDPKAWAGFIGQAVPSLFAAWKSGGSIPFMAWLEGMEGAASAREFEERTGQKMDDRTFVTASASVGMVNGLLEKMGLDSILKGKGGLARKFFGGMTGEAATEGAQSFTGNAVSRYMYDDEASLTEGVLPGMMGGAGTGGPAGFVSGVADKLAPPKDNLDTIRKKVVDDIDIAKDEEKGMLGLPQPTIVVTPEGMAASEANMQAAEEMGLRGDTVSQSLGSPEVDPSIAGDIEFQQPDMTGIGRPERGTRAGGEFQNWEGNIPFEDSLSDQDAAKLSELRSYAALMDEQGRTEEAAGARKEIDNFLQSKYGQLQLQQGDGKFGNEIEFNQTEPEIDLNLDLSSAPEPASPTAPPSPDKLQKIQDLRQAAQETTVESIKTDLLRQADVIEQELKGEKPKLTKAEQAEKNKKYDSTSEDLQSLIRKSGGIDTELESDWAGRLSSGQRKAFGMKAMERPGKPDAMSLDDLLERANEEGFNFNDKAALEEALDRIGMGEEIYSGNRSAESMDYEAIQNDTARFRGAQNLTPEQRADNETAELMDPERYERIIEPEDYKPSEKQQLAELADRAMAHNPQLATWVMGENKTDAETKELLQDILNNQPERASADEDQAGFEQPYDYKLRRYNKAADDEGLTNSQRKRFTPEDTRDDVTGMYKAEDRIPTMNRARDYVDANGTEGSYVDIDLRNLGGLNSAFSHTGANKHFKAFADIVNKRLANIGNTVTFRHGGDEMSVIAPDVSVEDMTAAMAAAQAEIDQYVIDNDLADLPHAKYEGASAELQAISKGTGIYFGASMIDTDVTNSEIIQLAEEQTEAQKPKKLMAKMQEDEANVNKQAAEKAGTGQDEPGAGAEGAAATDTEGQAARGDEAQAAQQDLDQAVDELGDLLPGESLSQKVDKLSNQLEDEFGLKSLFMFADNKGNIRLETIIVDKADRGKGKGTAVVSRIIEFADKNDLRITLTPAIKDDYQGTTSRARLVKFYKRLGFVENKGRNKDFEITESMYRDPQPVEEAGAKKAEEISAAAADATGHDASQAQIDASNFKKGHLFNMQGFKISIENEAGTKRNKMTPKSWPPLAHHYGDLTGTTGADGDPIDVFIKKGADVAADHPIFVINQKNKDGSFDEHKVMMGFDSAADAKQGYLDSYSDDFTGFKSIIELTADELRGHIDNGSFESEIAAAEKTPEDGETFLSEKADPKRRGKGREGDAPKNWSEEEIHRQYPELRFWVGDRVEIVDGGHSVGGLGTVTSILTYETRPDMIQKYPSNNRRQYHYYVMLDEANEGGKEEVPVWADEFLEPAKDSVAPVQAGLDLGAPEPTNDFQALRKKLEGMNDKDLERLAKDADLRISDGRENIIDRIIAVRKGLKAIEGHETTREIHAQVMNKDNRDLTVVTANKFGQAVMKGNEKSGAWGTSIDKFVRWANRKGGADIEISETKPASQPDNGDTDRYRKKMPVKPQLAESIFDAIGKIGDDGSYLPEWAANAVIENHNEQVKKLAKSGYALTQKDVSGSQALDYGNIRIMPDYLADPMASIRDVTAMAEVVDQLIEKMEAGKKINPETVVNRTMDLADLLGHKITPQEIIDSIPGLTDLSQQQADDFTLQQQTEQDIADKEAAQAKADEEQTAKDRADQAEAEQGEFVLSGSDRAVDQAEARGQRNMFDQPAMDDVREMTEEGMAKDGMPIKPGDKFRTSSGRETTPYPKQKREKYASQWLIDNAAAEAESRGDDFNAGPFKSTTILKSGELTPADLEGMLMYLFGEQPQVIPPITKTLTGEEKATKKPKESVEYRRAKMDLDAAMSDLGDILLDKNSLKVMPAETGKVLPVLTRLFDAAFRMGYYKFKDAAKFALDTVRDKLGDEAADAIDLKLLQGAYIAMSSGQQGAEGFAEVGAVTSVNELNEHEATQDETVTTSGMEPDSGTAGNGASDVQKSLFDDTGDAGPGAGQSKRTAGKTGVRKQGDTGVPDSGAAAVRKPGNTGISPETGRFKLDKRAADSDDRGRGGATLPKGVSADRQAEQELAKTAERDSDELSNKLDDQAKANKIPVKYGDIGNIRESLPMLHPEQQEDVGFIEARLNGNRGVLITNGTGTGKAQPLTAKVATPSGFRLMGDIQPGDEVMTESGSISKVLSIHPQGLKPIYRVSFSDGSFTECTSDHLWLTHTQYERRKASVNPGWQCAQPKVRTLQDIMNSMDSVHWIPISDAVAYPERELDIPPYTMGVLLGDGCVRGGTITISSEDDQIINRVSEDMLGNEFSVFEIKTQENRCREFRISDNLQKKCGTTGRFTSHRMVDSLKSMECWDKLAVDKHIPCEYLVSSIQQRQALLQGLLDTDGWVDRCGSPVFCSASKNLAEGIVELVQSLGGTATINYRDNSHSGAFTVWINLPDNIKPFRLSRKAGKYLPNKKYKPRRKIVSVDYIREDEAKCISIDSNSRLYLTDSYIVTHNTFTGMGTVRRYVSMGRDNIIIAVPGNDVATDWIEAGRLFGIDITMLKDKQDAGSGVVITTYANFGDNLQLASRDWDLVVTDEGHRLSENKDGNPTNQLQTLRALTGHPRGDYRYAEMMEPELTEEYRAIEKEINDLEQPFNAGLNSGAAPADVQSKIEALKDKARENRKVFRDRRPSHDAMLAERWDSQETKTLMLSASPFAYERSLDLAEGYLFEYGADPESGGYNTPSAREAFFIENLGYRMRVGKLTEPEADVDRNLMQRELNERLKSEGAVRGRRLEVDHDYSREFIAVDDLVGNKIDEGIDWVYDQAGSSDNPLRDGYAMLADIINDQFDYHSRMKLLEAIKAKAAVPRIKKHIDMGRQVVVFHSRIKGGGAHPFHINMPSVPDRAKWINQTIKDQDTSREDAANLYEEVLEKYKKLDGAIKEFNITRKDLVDLDLNSLKSPIEIIGEEFPGQAIFYNGRESKKKRREGYKLFNQDDSEIKIIVAQDDAAREGISLHDVTGKHQRVSMNLGLPVKPTQTIQLEGRTYRVGQMSDAIFEYFNTGTNFERNAFAHSIAGRSGTAENLAMGSEARNFTESFIESFEDPNSNDPHDSQGKGGKEADKSLEGTISRFEKAKTYYYGKQKNTRSRGEREGPDYYATAEPVGLKMVEFGHARAGEKMLEPSSGHGAIARFFPENTNNTAVEPMTDLASKTALRFNGEVKQTRFEDLDIANKYDVIVMNPPYGSGGATSTAHLAKAMNHLNDGGRIVALLPEGPAADKKLDALLYGKDNELEAMKNKVKLKTAKQGDYERRKAQLTEFITVADISLPGVAFKRAGTSVKTHIVVLERHTDMDNAPLQQGKTEVTAETVNELFDAIEGMTVPERGEVPQETTGNPQQSYTEEDIAAGKVDAKKVKAKRLDDTGSGIESRVIPDKDTRDNSDIWIVKIDTTLDRDRYKQSAALAKEHNGFYSRFKKGMLFKSATDAEAYQAALKEIDAGQDVREGDGVYEGYERKTSNLQVRQPDENQQKQAQLDLFSPDNVPGEVKADQQRDNFNVRYEQVEVGEISTGIDHIQSYEDAAHVIAPIRKHAQETVIAMVTDENGKVLNVIRHTKGVKGASNVSSVEVVAAIVATDGAANVWFAHNHPSGVTTPSGADSRITGVLNEAIEGSGVEVKGHVIVGDGMTFGSMDKNGKVRDQFKISPFARRKKLGITERILRKRKMKGAEALEEPQAARNFIERMNTKNGVILMDQRHRIVGVMATTVEEMKGLRGKKQIPRILKAIDSTNAAAAILVSEDAEASKNLGNYLARLGGLRLLDAMIHEPDGTVTSQAERGRDIGNSSEPFYSKRSYKPGQSGKAKGITHEEAVEAVEQFKRELGNPDQINIVTAPTKKSIMDPEYYDRYKNDQVSGYYVNATREAGGGGIVLILEDIESIDDAMETLRHEWIAHHGLNTFDPVTRKKIIDRLMSSKGEMSLKPAWEYIKKNYAEQSNEKQAEELLAYMAENKATRLSKLWNDIVLMIQKALKKVGIIRSDRVTKADVIGLVETLASRVGAGAKQQTFPDTTEISNRSVDDVVALIDEKSKGAAARIKHWVKRRLTKEGLLNESAFEARLRKDAEKNVGENDLSAMVYDFERAVEAAYGVKYNKMTNDDLAEVNAYLAGEKGIALPKGLHRKLDHMRAYLDRLSGGMQVAMADMLKIEASKLSEKDAAAFDMFVAGIDGGYLPKSMQKHWNLYQTIENNKGTYLTRSYRAFDDEGWKDTVLKDQDLMQRAMDYIAEQNPEFTRFEVIGAVREILQNAKKNGNFVSFMSRGTKLGTKDVSIITKRKKVPPVIRELLGEYKDPKLNFVRSVSKMQYFVANHNFLMSLRNEGLGVYLFEKPTGEFDDQIAGDDSETMNPINGLYTTEDFRQGLEDASGAVEGTKLMQDLVRVNAMVKYGKTILAPTTQFRNFMSAAMFSIMNGHFDWSHAKKSALVAKADLFTKDVEWRKYTQHLISLGVIHNNPYAGELRDAIRDFTEMSIYEKGLMQKPKQFLDFMQKTYQIGDDFWKIIGFENELQLQIEAGKTKAEAEKIAAYRIRNGYPTYSMVPLGIKKIRRWPLIGTFVSFPYEITRTSYNQIGFIKEDLAAGNKKMATRRILGASIAASAAYAASIISMLAMGMDDEDDEAVRKLLPPWSRNSQLIYTGYDENGMPTYYDLSYIDPYTYLKKPISAMLNGNNEGIDDKVLDALKEYLDPFIGVDIAAGALLEIASNQRAHGGKIYNEKAESWEKAKSILNHLRKAAQPGAFSNADRIIAAMGNETSRSGRQYKLGDEAWALIGHRIGTLNIPQSLVYKTFQFSEDKAEASMLLSYVSGSGEKISDDEMKKATKQMLKARKEVYNDMIKIVNAAKRLNISEDDIVDVMEASGMSRVDTAYILDEEAAPWDMPLRYGERGFTRAMITAQDAERKAEIETEYDRRMEVIDEILDEYYD